MGPHRFFSKSDRVMDWWLKMMPLAATGKEELNINYQNKSKTIKSTYDKSSGLRQKDPDKTMLVIQRLTRIYFLRKFFAYPIQLSFDTLSTLGIVRTIKILFSFLWARFFPKKPEASLEDFIINKFGRQLYLLFFKDYTEKVWGVPCREISAEWGAQRIKGVSLSKAIIQAVKSLGKKKGAGISQKDTETSLIEQFLYPKYGPGSLWEEVAGQVKELGGKIYHNQDVTGIFTNDGAISSVTTVNSQTGQTGAWKGDYFFSTMPVQELITGLGQQVPEKVREVAAGLQYRDFINVGILLKQLSTTGPNGVERLELRDNWIYIQERDVKVGRLMIYNNWGDGMISDPNTTWIGMEYFCNKTDAFWALTNESIQQAAISELIKMDLARTEDVLDITVARMEKTYPAYFGTYNEFPVIRAYTDTFENLFLIGRNGMHKYNNADHSMLTAMVAVDNIAAGIAEKSNIWSINTEQVFHEEKSPNGQPAYTGINEDRSTPIILKKNRKTVATNFFREYLLEHKENRAFLWIAGVAILVQFIVFKLLYPYAGFIDGDSYVYLQSAFFNSDINMYPIGYSKFLRLFSVFTKSDTALVAFQYLSIQAAALYFIFSLQYLYNPGKITKWVLFCFVVFNPVFLYISNYVSSDALFLSLSLLWFTILLSMLKNPSHNLIIVHAIVLLLAFSVRYNALYYPIIAAIAFSLSKQPLKRKLLGIGSAIIVIAGFIQYTSVQYYKLNGIWQFTPFSGWQLANNAMYAYRYVDQKDLNPVPQELRALDNTVRHYFDTTRDLKKHPVEMLVASTVYMWDPRSPLQIFMHQKYLKDSVDPLKIWASMAPLYAHYGRYLIRQHPIAFAEHYLWPNAIKYYVPPEEFLKSYNASKDSVKLIAQSWFGYKNRKVTTAFKNLEVSSLCFLPIFAGIINVLFLSSILIVGLLKVLKRESILFSTLLIAISLWTANFTFSVFASPITLRYQLFSILVFYSFSVLLLDIICKSAFLPPAIKKTI